MDNELQEGIDANLAELERLDASSRAFLKRRLIMWAIRWAAGFATIGIVVSRNPDWSWLWWVGAAFATLTPTMALVTHFILNRKSRQAREGLSELESGLEKEI